MSRMFLSPSGQPMRTWNVFTGCAFDCTYCNARKLATTRLKNTEKYRQGFTPRFHPGEMRRQFKPGEFVFVAYMGDLAFATPEMIMKILQRIRVFPRTDFLFCTKEPFTWLSLPMDWPYNLYLGATIETTCEYELTKAPPPVHRFNAMKDLDHPLKFISIEPVMDFDLELMLRWMAKIKPQIIEVGADNYHNDLPEPSPAKLRGLLENLKKQCPHVIEKKGLERILKEEG